jgi:hypothetical protein
MFTKAVVELKEMMDQLLEQVNPLETQVPILNGTIMHTSTELHAKELGLERTTGAKVDFQRQNSKLVKKLKGNQELFSITLPHILSVNQRTLL